MPLPNVKDWIEKLAKKKVFSALDLASAFHQLELCEKTKLMCGFVTFGQRDMTHRIPFGAHPCPAKLERKNDEFFNQCRPTKCLATWTTYSTLMTWKKINRTWKKFFRLLRQHGLKLSPT